MEPLDQMTPPGLKKRHGCVTAWLIIMIIGNGFSAFVYFLASPFITDSLPGPVPTLILTALGILGLLNVFFAIMLLNWKKYAFWGFVGTAVAAVIINISIGLGIGMSLLGLIGIGLLYGILQIKEGTTSAWEQLE